jgi:hypothetical protein
MLFIKVKLVTLKFGGVVSAPAYTPDFEADRPGIESPEARYSQPGDLMVYTKVYTENPKNEEFQDINKSYTRQP